MIPQGMRNENSASLGTISAKNIQTAAWERAVPALVPVPAKPGANFGAWIRNSALNESPKTQQGELAAA